MAFMLFHILQTKNPSIPQTALFPKLHCRLRAQESITSSASVELPPQNFAWRYDGATDGRKIRITKRSSVQCRDVQTKFPNSVRIHSAPKTVFLNSSHILTFRFKNT